MVIEKLSYHFDGTFHMTSLARTLHESNSEKPDLTEGIVPEQP